MKKLIAQRPIQYLGRYYERGAALPANDPLMTEAWLKAGSAAWEGPPAEEAPEGPAPDPGETLRREAERQAAEVLASYGVAITDEAGNFIGKEELVKQLISVPTAEAQAADTLRALGVEFMDEDGRFVGEERLKEQLCGLVQELLPGYEDVVPAAGGPEGGALPEEEAQSGAPAGTQRSGSGGERKKEHSGRSSRRKAGTEQSEVSSDEEAGKPDPPPEGLPPGAPA